MPLFQLNDGALAPIAQTSFLDERTLQRLVEKNLKVVFNSRFVASEFRTGQVHGGRIDTLALSEDGNPVIIEYKNVPSSELITQSLYYLAWIRDHHGDFEIAVQKALGSVEIDWPGVRVICLAPSYKKYDLHAAQVMSASIELWTFRRFANDVLYFEEVLQRATESYPSTNVEGKDPVMVAAGKKAALTRALGGWTFDQHLDLKPDGIRELAIAIQEFLLNMDPTIEESPKKFYIAYRTSQNIVCMEVQQKKILLFLKLDPKLHGPPGISRDVSSIGHYGTGDLEITIKTTEDLELAKPSMKLAYDEVGG